MGSDAGMSRWTGALFFLLVFKIQYLDALSSNGDFSQLFYNRTSLARPLVSLSIQVGDNQTELVLFEGDDVATEVGVYGDHLGIPQGQKETLLRQVQAYLGTNGINTKPKVVGVLSSINDLHIHVEKTLSTSITEAVASAVSLGEGTGVVLVTMGYSLQPTFKTTITNMVNKQGGFMLDILEMKEFYGFSAAINTAVRSIKGDYLVTIMDLHMRLSDDLTVGYWREKYQANFTEGLLMTGYRKGLLPLPLLVFDKETYTRLGPLDEGYLFQSGIADWIYRARTQGILQDLPQSIYSIVEEEDGMHGQTLGKEYFHSWAQKLDITSLIGSREELEAAMQKDLDTYFLQASEALAYESCRTNDGLCKRALEPPEEEMRNTWWMGRGMSSDLIANDWRKNLKVAAVVCLYDDTTFIEELLLDLVKQIDHVLILLSDSPWHGIARDNSHTLKKLGALIADGKQSRNRISLVVGHWKTEAQQRQFGNDVIRMLPENYTHVMVVDGDEFWHPVELQVRTDSELVDRKLASFSHAHEVLQGWIQDKWHAWDRNNSLEDLHPTSPHHYKRAVAQPFYMLPPVLRRLHIQYLDDGRREASCEREQETEAMRWIMTYVTQRCDGHGPCSIPLAL